MGADIVEDAPVARRGILVACAVTATLMQSLDTTIANVALPYMQGTLSASQDEINWVLTSYIVAAAIMTTPTGWLSDRFGRRRFFALAVGSFTAASVLCGAAQTLPQMVVFRLLQGVFGAALVPMSQSLMFDLFPAEKRGQAMALWGIGVMIGPVLGPTLGGWLTEEYTWRWVFYINLPVGILTTIGMLVFLPDKKRPTGRFDWTGFGLLGIAVGSLQLFLDRGQELDWFGSSEIITEACVCGLACFCFLVHLALFETPLVSPRLFRDINFFVGCTFIFVVGVVLYATLALLTPYLQTLIGYPVLSAGLLLGPRGIGTMAGMFVTGRLLGRVNVRLLMLFGFATLIGSLDMMMRFSPDVSVAAIIESGLLQGVSTGFLFTASSLVTFTTLPVHLRTQGTSLYSLIRNIGSSIGISVTGALLVRNTQINHASIAALVTPFNRMLNIGAVARFWNPSQASGAASLNAEITRQATTIAFSDDFKLMLILGVIAAPMVFLLKTKASGAPASPAADLH